MNSNEKYLAYDRGDATYIYTNSRPVKAVGVVFPVPGYFAYALHGETKSNISYRHKHQAIEALKQTYRDRVASISENYHFRARAKSERVGGVCIE